jgi:multidrug efflux pump subunit AcrA (membrane-fusion protein)
MTVDLEIVLDSVREATMVPIRAVFTEDGKRSVYRARGKGFERVPVSTGRRNDLMIELRSGVVVGDRVALERPSALSVRNAEVKR